jgi:hypothetical protein
VDALYIIERLPIFTTIMAVIFSIDLFRHWSEKKTMYLLWWGLGVVFYGLGTAAESVNALFGFSIGTMKFWYIVGALLGGWPLAQGSVYLLMKRKFADISTVVFLVFISIATVFIVLSPVTIPADFDGRLTGSVMDWQWVRLFSPFVNGYAFVFLVGGALFSAVKLFKRGIKEKPFAGNIFIAIGGLLPGIGGSFTRAGVVGALYITEVVGLAFIYLGYRMVRAWRRAQQRAGEGIVVNSSSSTGEAAKTQAG